MSDNDEKQQPANYLPSAMGAAIVPASGPWVVRQSVPPPAKPVPKPGTAVAIPRLASGDGPGIRPAHTEDDE